MWANAQHDAHPAYYRWRPVFNPAVWLTPITRVPCSNAAKMQKLLTLAGVSQTRQQISAISGPKFTILWVHVGEILLFNSFFSYCHYVPTLVVKIWPDKVVRWCPDGEFLAMFCVLGFQ